jgi:hypothetical protein
MLFVNWNHSIACCAPSFEKPSAELMYLQDLLLSLLGW